MSCFSPLASLAAQSAASGNAENGKRQFVKLGCYTCHGYEGQGGGAGAKLAPHPIATVRLIAYVRHPAGQHAAVHEEGGFR